MKRFHIRNIRLFFAINVVALLTAATASASFLPLPQYKEPRFKHVVSKALAEKLRIDSIEAAERLLAAADSIAATMDTVPEPIHVRTLEEILAETPTFAEPPSKINKLFGPWIFSGYRHIPSKSFSGEMKELSSMELWRLSPQVMDSVGMIEEPSLWMPVDTVGRPFFLPAEELTILNEDVTPDWLRDAMTADRIQEAWMYKVMVENPATIEYAYWDLPVPPRLPDDDVSYVAYVKSLNLPSVDVSKAFIPEIDHEKRHWLHVFNTGLQFSQAYVSKNWYQGGSDYLSLLFNFFWDVQINTVYHPNLLFQSTLSYKLGLNSENDDKYHKYSISQDIFQYNLKAGVKAVHNWFYSFTMQFKTQLLNSYPKNSEVHTSSFLSPGDLNLGLGMTYSKQNKKKTAQFNASIAPISYNMRTCIDPLVNHEQYNVKPDHKFHNEIGSNAELTFNWKMSGSVSYYTRMFLFTDYNYFVGDWENTLNFQFNKFFSTQLYAHLRYDTSVDSSIAPNWHKWMLKEILSVGLSYTFSTKI